jgi:hypothetical protein
MKSMATQGIVFDFDLTLSAYHVFNYLSREASPIALSEMGQLSLITELNNLPTFSQCGGFAVKMMGGPFRIEELRRMLSMLSKFGVDCVICTKGLVGPVTKILSDAGLLDFFSGVYGNTGVKYGQSAFDESCDLSADDLRFLSQEFNQIDSTKREFIEQYMGNNGFCYENVIFVDDTYDEIASAEDLCRTVHVSTLGGMDHLLCRDILDMAAAHHEAEELEMCSLYELTEEDDGDATGFSFSGWWSCTPFCQKKHIKANMEKTPR